MSTLDQGKVRGEVVVIIGPTPDDWSGLGSGIKGEGALLVQYPDGEVGSVHKSDIDELESNGH